MQYRPDSYLIWACYGDSCDIPPDIPSNIAVVGGRREVWEKMRDGKNNVMNMAGVGVK